LPTKGKEIEVPNVLKIIQFEAGGVGLLNSGDQKKGVPWELLGGHPFSKEKFRKITSAKCREIKKTGFLN